jgi:hypothetical protein
MNTYVDEKLIGVADKVSVEKITTDKGEFILISYYLPRCSRLKKLLIKSSDFLSAVEKNFVN